MVEDELAPAVEQNEKVRLSVRPLEDVGLVDLDHRLPAAAGGEGVASFGGGLLLGEELLVRLLPFTR